MVHFHVFHEWRHERAVVSRAELDVGPVGFAGGDDRVAGAVKEVDGAFDPGELAAR